MPQPWLKYYHYQPPKVCGQQNSSDPRKRKARQSLNESKQAAKVQLGTFQGWPICSFLPISKLVYRQINKQTKTHSSKSSTHIFIVSPSSHLIFLFDFSNSKYQYFRHNNKLLHNLLKEYPDTDDIKITIYPRY